MDIIAKNLKEYRNKLDYTQADIAAFLSITREEVNYYENGKRTVPLNILLKLSDLYGVEIGNFNETDPEKHKSMLSLSFRKDNFIPQDYDVLSQFIKVVKNYSKIKRLCNAL
ncbi:MAG: helix-turn-helix transcriptional regulator [Spirochaetales bacterium]|nr:helix-turn-helix transcriptional regulator [Spirochaetales bacterium]